MFEEVSLLYFIVERDASIIWRGFSCCGLHALMRARFTGSKASVSAMIVHGPLSPEHPIRRLASA